MKQVNWGIIGLGAVASQFSKGFKFASNAKLIGIASKDNNKIKKFYNSVMVRSDLIIAGSNFIFSHIKENYNKITTNKKIIKLGIKILNYNKINEYLLKSKSKFTILSISGYESLFFLNAIFKNTNNLGLVNKECVVSCGHLFNKLTLFF